MYVRTYVCTYVCMYVYMCVCVCAANSGRMMWGAYFPSLLKHGIRSSDPTRSTDVRE
jgi:hypothetical protein